jgi:hypothetical protein
VTRCADRLRWWHWRGRGDVGLMADDVPFKSVNDMGGELSPRNPTDDTN